MEAIADHGARFVGANLLYLQDGTRTHFMAFLAREYPHLSERYDRLFAGRTRVPKEYAAEVNAMVDRLQERAGLTRRSRAEMPEKAGGSRASEATDAQADQDAGDVEAPPRSDDAAQGAFRWDD